MRMSMGADLERRRRSASWSRFVFRPVGRKPIMLSYWS